MKLPDQRSAPTHWGALILIWILLDGPLLGGESPRTATARGGGTLRLAMESDPHSLDPAQGFSNDENMLAFLLFNTLLDIGPGGELGPGVAVALPETSVDGRTHTFRLRHGIHFSNGQELNSDDVVYTFERLFDPGESGGNAGYYGSILGSAAFHEARLKEFAAPADTRRQRGERWIEPLTVAGLEALDRYTVRLRLEQPDLCFLKQIAVSVCAIVPRDEVKRAGKRFGSHPLGSGPFLLEEWVRGARLRFFRNPHYVHPNPSGPSEVDILLNLDSSTQSMMFERGELDIQGTIPDPDFVRLHRTPSLRSKLQVVTGRSPTFIFLNCEMFPFTNRLVRLALNHAVDKLALVKILANRCVVSRGVVPLAVSGFDQQLPEYAYDPAKARGLLVQAGFTNGFATTLWVARETPSYLKIALYVQQCLREINVRVDLKVVSGAAYLDLCGRRRTVPMGVWDWASGIDDPKETLDCLLNGNNITDENCLNNAFYTNPRVQNWFREAVAEPNPARRLNRYRQIERQIVDDAPWIFLVQFNQETMMQPWVKGIKPGGFVPTLRLEHCWLER